MTRAATCTDTPAARESERGSNALNGRTVSGAESKGLYRAIGRTLSVRSCAILVFAIAISSILNPIPAEFAFGAAQPDARASEPALARMGHLDDCCLPISVESLRPVAQICLRAAVRAGNSDRGGYVRRDKSTLSLRCRVLNMQDHLKR